VNWTIAGAEKPSHDDKHQTLPLPVTAKARNYRSGETPARS